ncbi:MAG: MurR/RpiR family transcriptional regulator, partial [Solobacterium sp.]|nr:MurR/RpiR family transcriptional regulator [Solobacterium sp.]
NFTQSEMQITEYVLSHSMEIMDLTAEELAKKTFTSKASVIRFCKKLGLKGYREFQNKLIYEMNTLNKAHLSISREFLGKNAAMKEILEAVPVMYESAIGRLWPRFSEKELEQTVQLLASAQELEIYGSGYTLMLAEEAAFKFNSIGIKAMAMHGLNEHAVEAGMNRKNKVAIVLSFTGGNPYMVSIARYLRKKDYTVIGIGGESSSALSVQCAIYFSIELEEHVMSLEVIQTSTAMRYVLDILFVSLFIRDYEGNISRSLALFKNKYFEG